MQSVGKEEMDAVTSFFFFLTTHTISFCPFQFDLNRGSYLEIRKVFLHKAIDLTDWEAASFAVLQSHGNQTAEKKNHQGGKKNH